MAKVDFDHKKMEERIREKERQLIAVGLQMQEEIKNSMKPGSGRVYVKGKNKDIVHQASSPGDPPAVDTGRLQSSISTNWTGSGMARGVVGSKASSEDGVGVPNSDGFHVLVGTNVEYAPFLEFGTRRMAARPFVRPIFDLFSSKVPELMSASNITRAYKEKD